MDGSAARVAVPLQAQRLSWFHNTVIVTAAGDGTTDIISRVFAPSAGIAEDPVTGSAHCTLANFWCDRLAASELFAEQVSARGGLVQIRLDHDHVVISGHAVTVYSGELHT